MTDSPAARATSPGLRRWPTEPAYFADTTRCPACFELLVEPRCIVCGLDLATPDAVRLLAAGTRVRDAESDRQVLLGEVFVAQAAAPCPCGSRAR